MFVFVWLTSLSMIISRFIHVAANGIISFSFYGWVCMYVEKAMAPHSSTLAWRIPWMEEPGGLQSMGSLGVRWLSNFTFTFHFHALEKEMATHSSVLAWRIPGMGKPGGLPSMGSHRVRHDWGDLAAACMYVYVVAVHLLIRVWLFAIPWTAAHQALLSFTICWSLLRFMCVESVILSNCLILCHPLLLFLRSFPASESFPMSWFFPSGSQILELHFQHQSFHWIFRTDFL